MSFGDALIDVVVWVIAILIVGALLLMGLAVLPILLPIILIALIVWIANSDSAMTVIGIGVTCVFCLILAFGLVETWKDRRDPSRRHGWCKTCMAGVSVSLGTVDEHIWEGNKKCPGTGKPRATDEERATHQKREAQAAEQAAAYSARVAEASKAARATATARAKAQAVRGPKPNDRLIRTPRDAEVVAAEWMEWMGFSDARATPVGTDGGIDVTSVKAIAQVKMEGVVTGRPVLQGAYGVGQAEGKLAIVFSLAGFTAQAREWASRVDMPLFRFRPAGDAGADQ